MPTAYQIENSGDWVSYDAYPIRNAAATAIYTRLYNWSGADEVGMYKSVDEGVTWSPVGVNFVPGGGANSYAGSGVKIGDVIYIPYQYWFDIPFPGTQHAEVAMARFDMNTDSWLAPWLSGILESDYIHSLQCGARSDGSLVVAYTSWDGAVSRSRMYTTVDVAGVWSAASTMRASIADVERFIGPVAVDSTDTAHFFYPTNPGGIGISHRQLSSAGILPAPAVVTADGGYFLNSAIVTISGVESVAFSGNPVPSLIPTIYTSPVATAAFTATAAPTSEQLQWITAITSSLYAAWPGAVGGGGDFIGVDQAVLQDGVWSAQETIESGAATWFEWTVNAMSATELGFVLGDFDDFTPWFLLYPLGEPPTPEISTQLFGGGIPTPGPRCVVEESPEQLRMLAAGVTRGRTNCETAYLPLYTPTPVTRRPFGSRSLRCIP